MIDQLRTWSIAARDPGSGQLGIATTSCHIAVGAYVARVRPGVAAACTQAYANAALAPCIYAAIESGADPAAAIAAALSHDDAPDTRQIAVVDHLGRTAAYTGLAIQNDRSSQWWGHHEGAGYVVAGNTLAGPAVVTDTAHAFEALRAAGESLAWSLVLALSAGQAAGGDHRGKQAAALLVGAVGRGASEYRPAVDLRVDDHPEPLVELQRLCRLLLGPPRTHL